MKTRAQYMNKECTHQEYYGQFGEILIEVVSNCIGVERIQASTDPHFNDIPLIAWDRLHGVVGAICGRRLGEVNGTGGYSLSDTVCAAKAAAQIIRGEQV